MKTAHDPRHLQRIKVVQELFAWDFNQKIDKTFFDITKKILKNKAKIDRVVEKAAPAWPLKKINKIDLAILRQAVFELLIDKTIPPKVVVDEAVEIAKEYGSDSSASFVNGVLGKVIEDKKILI